MANVVYPKYRDILGTTGGPNLTSADIRVIMIDLADYTYNAAHEFLSDVAGAARVATSANLSSKTFASVGTGVFDAADQLISGITGDPVEALIIYNHTGVEATSRLLAFIDTFASGMPFTPPGNATIQWAAGGIFII